MIEVFNQEQTAAKAAAKANVKQCADTSAEIEKLVADGNKAKTEALEDIEAITAEAESLRTEIQTTKNSIKGLGEEIDELVQRLATLRADEKKRKEEAIKSLQQVRAVISQTSLRQRAAKVLEARLGSKRRGEVSYLKELGKRLSAPPAFLQVRSVQQSAANGVRGADLALQQERQLQQDGKELQEAEGDGDKTFDEEEKELIELIRMKREELVKLEDALRGQQPALADKLKQAAETNRTLLGANRSIERDGSMLTRSKEKCQLFDAASANETKMRSKLLDSLKISNALLEHVDTTAFIAKDVRELRVLAHSFLQVAMSRPGARLYKSSPSVSLLQASSEQDSEAADSQTVMSGGPFDSVSQMIEELIASLKAEANQDVDQHQFCEESKAQNRRARHMAENSIDERTTEIHWAQTAIERLDDEISFLESETTRLAGAVEANEEATKAAEKLFEEESQHRAKANDVIDGAVSVLVELCELQSAASLISTSSGGNASIVHQARYVRKSDQRSDDCSRVVDELDTAKTLLGKFGDLAATNIEKTKALMSGIVDEQRADVESRNLDLLTAKQAKGRRADELASAKEALTNRKKDLALVQEAKKNLEQNCGPARETHEERQARRKQEIDALKNALSVLEGEAVPVDT